MNQNEIVGIFSLFCWIPIGERHCLYFSELKLDIELHARSFPRDSSERPFVANVSLALMLPLRKSNHAPLKALGTERAKRGRLFDRHAAADCGWELARAIRSTHLRTQTAHTSSSSHTSSLVLRELWRTKTMNYWIKTKWGALKIRSPLTCSPVSMSVSHVEVAFHYISSWLIKPVAREKIHP